MLRTSIVSSNCNQSNKSEEQHISSSSGSAMMLSTTRQSRSHQGTPNDVRMFPMTGSSRRERLTGSVNSSPSIPIAPSERSESEIQLEDDEAKAQFREHVMYQRIFYSMRESNNGNNKMMLQQHSIMTRTTSLPYFPVLPHAIATTSTTTHNDSHQATTQTQDFAPAKVVSFANTNNALWQRSLDMMQQQDQGHTNMVGREFSFTKKIGTSSSTSSCCNDDEDFVFEMDDM